MRRSHRGEPCTSRNREHRARVEIEEDELALPPPKRDLPEWTRHRDDARWPAHCDLCGYAFVDADERVLFYRRLYRAADGRETILDDAPPGAMWDAFWLGPEYRGEDGLHLAVMTPGGPWYVDGRSPVSFLRWVRWGTPPDVSAKPSIFIPGRYHGWLQDGFLREY